jgi:aspartate aminotransferase
MRAVRKAEELLLEENNNHEYTTILGIPEFRDLTLDVVFGADGENVVYDNVAFAQTVSGTNALRVTAELYKKFDIGSGRVYLSNPTWRNHRCIFERVGFDVMQYRYIKDEKLDFVNMCKDIMNAPNNSLFLFHACAHNPTGVDPNTGQWMAMEKLIRERGHHVIFDMAYQGYSTGNLAHDAFPVRYFAKKGHSLSVAQTYSKNMGMYGERVGSLSVIAPNSMRREALESHINIIIRPMHSTPPINGGRIVVKILSTPSLKTDWESEMYDMYKRVKTMREMLKAEFDELGTKLNSDAIVQQCGMFYLVPIKPSHVKTLREKYSIYMIDSGRLSIVGLTESNVKYVAKAIHDVIQSE